MKCITFPKTCHQHVGCARIQKHFVTAVCFASQPAFYCSSCESAVAKQMFMQDLQPSICALYHLFVQGHGGDGASPENRQGQDTPQTGRQSITGLTYRDKLRNPFTHRPQPQSLNPGPFCCEVTVHHGIARYLYCNPTCPYAHVACKEKCAWKLTNHSECFVFVSHLKQYDIPFIIKNK